MRRHLGIVTLAGLVVLALLVYTVAFQVDEFRDIVLIKRFGKVRSVYRGADQAGLHFKWFWPVEEAVRYDARTFAFESPYAQLETRDKQNILVSMYCMWRIAEPRKFHQVLETQKVARQSIRERLQSKSGDVVGQYDLQSFVNTDPERMQLDQIQQEILALLKSEVEDEYGVEVRKVGIKMWGLPEAVSSDVIEAQKDERQKFAQEYKSRGEARATAIRERAKSSRDTIIAFAERKASEIRAEGARAAAEIYPEFEKDPQLSEFLRWLDTLEAGLKERTVMILDGSELPALKWFRKGPGLEDIGAAGAASVSGKEGDND